MSPAFSEAGGGWADGLMGWGGEDPNGWRHHQWGFPWISINWGVSLKMAGFFLMGKNDWENPFEVVKFYMGNNDWENPLWMSRGVALKMTKRTPAFFRLLGIAMESRPVSGSPRKHRWDFPQLFVGLLGG